MTKSRIAAWLCMITGIALCFSVNWKAGMGMVMVLTGLTISSLEAIQKDREDGE